MRSEIRESATKLTAPTGCSLTIRNDPATGDSISVTAFVNNDTGKVQPAQCGPIKTPTDGPQASFIAPGVLSAKGLESALKQLGRIVKDCTPVDPLPCSEA